MKGKVTVKKTGEELKKCNRKIEVLKKGMDKAVNSLCKLGERIKEIKEELQNIQRTRAVLQNDVNEMEQEAIMEESMKEELVVDEEVEEGGHDEEGEARSTEEGPNNVEKEDVDMEENKL